MHQCPQHRHPDAFIRKKSPRAQWNGHRGSKTMTCGLHHAVVVAVAASALRLAELLLLLVVVILLLLLKLTRLLRVSMPFPGQQRRKEAVSRGPQAEARPLRKQAEGGQDRGGGGSGRARRGREGQGQEDRPKNASGRSWLCRSCLAQNQKTERTIDEIGLPWKSEGLAVVGTRCLESTYDDKRHAIQTPQINGTVGHGRRVDPERKSLMSPTKSREGKERKDGQHLISRYNKERHRRQGCSNVAPASTVIWPETRTPTRHHHIGIWKCFFWHATIL
jgi:hypothetical protein